MEDEQGSFLPSFNLFFLPPLSYYTYLPSFLSYPIFLPSCLLVFYWVCTDPWLPSFLPSYPILSYLIFLPSCLLVFYWVCTDPWLVKLLLSGSIKGSESCWKTSKVPSFLHSLILCHSWKTVPVLRNTVLKSFRTCSLFSFSGHADVERQDNPKI